MTTSVAQHPASTASSTAAAASATATGTTARHRDDRDELALLPPVDVIEDAQGITLYADLPGVPREALDLRVDGDQLLIEARMQLDLPAGLTPGHAEVKRQLYRRAFTLSKELDADQVSAELTQGVLTVRIPKAAHAQPRKIEVRLN